MKKIFALALCFAMLLSPMPRAYAMMGMYSTKPDRLTKYSLIPVFELRAPRLFPDELKSMDRIATLNDIIDHEWNEPLAYFLADFCDNYFCDNYQYFMSSNAMWNIIDHISSDMTCGIPENVSRGIVTMNYIEPDYLRKLISEFMPVFGETVPISQRTLLNARVLVESFCYMDAERFIKLYQQMFIYFFNTRDSRDFEVNKVLHKNLLCFEYYLLSIIKHRHTIYSQRVLLERIQAATDPEKNSAFKSDKKLTPVSIVKRTVSPVDTIFLREVENSESPFEMDI